MVLFPKGITLVFLVTSLEKPWEVLKGVGRGHQMVKTTDADQSGRAQFETQLGFWQALGSLQANSLSPGKSSRAPQQQNGRAQLSFSCSTSCLQREKALEHWCSGSRTQENQVQLQWMHTKITWAWNCHKTVTSNCQPSAGMPELWEQALTLKSKLGLRNGRGSWSLSLSSWKHQPLDCWVDDEHLYSEREV